MTNVITLAVDCECPTLIESFRLSQLQLTLSWKWYVPRKIRELIKDLKNAGFTQVPGAGKGSHRKFTHANYDGAVTLSGQDGDDAKKYQEKQVKLAVEEVKP